MTTKVYIVFEGEYSDRGVSAVFLEGDLAKAYVATKPLDCPSIEIWDIYLWECAKKDIEKGKKKVKFGYEFILSEESGELLKEKPQYDVIFMNGYWFGYTTGGKFYRGRYLVSVFAKNDSEKEYQRCLKVARDKLAKAKAKKEGL